MNGRSRQQRQMKSVAASAWRAALFGIPQGLRTARRELGGYSRRLLDPRVPLIQRNSFNKRTANAHPLPSRLGSWDNPFPRNTRKNALKSHMFAQAIMRSSSSRRAGLKTTGNYLRQTSPHQTIRPGNIEYENRGTMGARAWLKLRQARQRVKNATSSVDARARYMRSRMRARLRRY